MTFNNETINNEKTNEKKKDNGKNASADNPSANNLWGSDMYPERRGGKMKHSWFDIFTSSWGREKTDNTKCEYNVYECVKSSPIVKLMLGALKKYGCEIDIRRHISCEICNPMVNGGYDSEYNQIVVCQNVANSKSMVQVVLLHEMIHMFDFCRNKLDMDNVDHIACSEIRAANIGHCSFIGSMMQGMSSPFNIKETHKDCVKNKAKMSVMTAKKISAEEAEAAIERVFTRCYNDLEPVGRRIRKNSEDMSKAYAEAYLYGYDRY